MDRKAANSLTEEEQSAVQKAFADFGSGTQEPLPEAAPHSPPESQMPKKKRKAWLVYLCVVLVIALGFGIGYAIWADQIENHPNCMAKQKSTISANGSNFAAIRDGGTVLFDGFTFPLDEDQWVNMASIDVSQKHIVGLGKDGTVVFSGSKQHGQECVQWTDITAISAGTNYTIGLRSDGTVLAAGNNDYGQCNVQDWKDIIGIDASSFFTAGLHKDGTVVVTEILSNSVLVDQDTFSQLSGELASVSRWKDIVAISASPLNLVGLKKDGTVVAVGYNGNNQLDVQDWTDIVSVSAGQTLTIGVRKDGSAVISGFLPYASTAEYQSLYADFANLTSGIKIVSACSSLSKIYLLSENGTVYGVGYNIVDSTLSFGEVATNIKLPK